MSPPEVNRHRILGNTLIITGTSFIVKVVAYIYFILIAKTLQDDEMGVFAVFLTGYLILELFTNLGIDKILIREVASRKSIKRVVSQTLVIKFLAGLAGYILSIVILQAAYPDFAATYYPRMLLFFSMIFPLLICRTLESVLTGEERMGIPGLGQLIERGVLLLGALLLSHHIFSFSDLLVCFPVAALARLVVCRVGFKLTRPPRWGAEVTGESGMTGLLEEAGQMLAVEALALLYFRVDIFMLSGMTDPATTGVYHVVYKIFDCFIVFFSGFLTALFPLLSRKKGNINLWRILVYGSIVLLLVSGTVILFRKQILIFFKPEYLRGEGALTLLMLTLPIIYINSMMGNLAVATGKLRLLLGLAICMFLFNITLNYVLIPRFSLHGAALATLICEAVLTAGFCFNLRHYIFTETKADEKGFLRQ